MCKLIAELVGSDEQIVRQMIMRLEKASGEPKIDVRLTGEIYGQSHMKLRALGLDPSDTTADELYHGLLNLAELHDDYLKKHYGLEDTATSLDIAERTAHIMNRLKLNRHAWLLKPAVAKRLLKQNPPKRLTKLLHYRSLDSLLKRESVEALLALAVRLESAAWLNQLHKQYKKLTPSDYEIRQIEITYLPAKRWAQIADLVARKYHTHVISSIEMGSVLILPIVTTKTQGLTLLTSLLALRGVNEIRQHSTYLKFHQVQPNFGELLTETVYKGKQDHVTLAGQPVHWRVVHKYYGAGDHHPEIFTPHVQAEDMAYRKAEAVLYRLEPALHFWHDLDYVGLPQEDGPISFNLIDVTHNLVNKLPYKRRLSYHMRDALWGELYHRYLAQSSLETQLLAQLDERVVGSDDISMNLFADMELFT